jgi:uncharacterized protein (UPF0332 family)
MDENLNLAAAELELAAQALRAAHLLERNQLARAAVAQAYYAALHGINALLAAHGMRPSSHDGAQTLFGLHFVKPGAVDAEHGRRFARLYAQRLIADYKGVVELGGHDAAQSLADVRPLLEAVAAQLRPLAPPGSALQRQLDALLGLLK